MPIDDRIPSANSPDGADRGALDGVRVVEIADDRGEYAGLLLAGMGAQVIKVEPPNCSPTRTIGPFIGDVSGPERSLFFALHNRAKQSVALDLDDPRQTDRFVELVASADVVLDSTEPRFLDDRGVGRAAVPGRSRSRPENLDAAVSASHLRPHDRVR